MEDSIDAQNTADSGVDWDSPYQEEPKPRKPSKYPGFRRCDAVDAPIQKKDRHRFGAPSKFQVPNPYDMTFWQARKVIEAWQEYDVFQKFAHEMKLSALNCAPTIYYACDTAPVVHMLFQESRVIKVQLKLVCDLELGWGSSTVMLRDGDRWIPLIDYLKSLPVLDFASTGQVGWWVQERWWRSIGGPFRLLDLPPELWQTILLYALGEEVFPRPPDYKHSQLSLTQGFRRSGFTEDRPNISPTNISVLGLNQVLADVARTLLWGETTKVYHRETELPVLRQPGFYVPDAALAPPQCFRFIRRMKLSLSPMDLITTFRVEVEPFTEDWHAPIDTHNRPSGELFRHLPCLKFLELETDAFELRSIDWQGFSVFSDPDDEHDGVTLHCSETVLNMVMAFAAEYLQSVKTVRLTGVVKKSAKDRWEKLLNQASYENNKPILEAMKDEFRKFTRFQVPPICYCAEPCATYDYTYGKAAEEEAKAAKAGGYVFCTDGYGTKVGPGRQHRGAEYGAAFDFSLLFSSALRFGFDQHYGEIMREVVLGSKVTAF
ncbi:unnamed protein product [Zymoseptoria tritici ST99CH_1E4]|uniref:Uncharacterized protein n=1 Tax=Zymoseptoria tritici ST99CH_1E4 TaxID=1276532 RepID=A0A2H1GT03_ZYMTR|nr:unnamed protein product [Zymoseptoria tritici ST99CH_1E4]